MKGFSLRSTVAAKAAPAAPAQPQPQPTTAQQQARAAEAEKLRAAAAAKKQLAGTPWVNTADMAKLPIAEQRKVTAIWKANKEAVEAGANLTKSLEARVCGVLWGARHGMGAACMWRAGRSYGDACAP